MLLETKQTKNSDSSGISGLYSIYMRANALFQDIQTVSELRLDASVSGDIVDVSSARVQKLCRGSFLTAEDFVRRISSEEGMEAYVRYCASRFSGAVFPPYIELDAHFESKEKTVRKPCKKRKDVPEKEVAAEMPGETPDDSDALVAMKKICAVLLQKRKIDLLSLVVDPNDFSQTVENLLYLSFAVKLERAFISQENGGLYVTPHRTDRSPGGTHAILCITKDEADAFISQASTSQTGKD